MDFLCACNRRACDGICKETHLRKPTKEKNGSVVLCGAAYIEADERKAMYRNREND